VRHFPAVQWQASGGVSSAAGAVGGTARDGAGNARSAAGSASQFIGDNALAAAAIAVAAGAAIGLIIPATETERRVIGDAGGPDGTSGSTWRAGA